MPFIETTKPENANGTVADMYERQQAAWGYVPNYAKVFCHRPEVMARWGRLLAEIKRPMDKRTFELATFVAAQELNNRACTLAHGKALREFFTDEQIVAIAVNKFGDTLTDAEAALVRFARQVAKDASRVTSGQVRALKQFGYSDAEIFDIATTAAGRAFFTKVLDALGVEADAPFRALEPEFREPLAVGRPIDVREPVRLPEPRAAVSLESL
jgi:uncharacterized peroxidase-related enzyme